MTLLEKYESYNATLKAKGFKFTTYRCPACGKEIETRKPKKADLGVGRSCWDSCRSCPYCEALTFVQVYPSGKGVVTPLGEEAPSG